MTNPIPINLVVEDDLSEVLLRKILKESDNDFAVGTSYGKCGYGYIKRRIQAFNFAARGIPFIVLSDLEAKCAPAQVKSWLPIPKHNNLLFRIAVPEIESWLLADRSGFSSFLNVKRELIPKNTDAIPKPKQSLINLAKRSRKRPLREAIVPRPGTTAKVGPDYNGQLSSFVSSAWDIKEALKHSESLRKAVRALKEFQPIWTNA